MASSEIVSLLSTMEADLPEEVEMCGFTYFVHKRESWTEKECEKRARAAPKNAFGDRPPRGLINNVGSPYPTFGQHRRYNGGDL